MLSHWIPETQPACNTNQCHHGACTIADKDRYPIPENLYIQDGSQRTRQRQHNEKHRSKVRMLLTKLRRMLGTFDDVDTLQCVIRTLEDNHRIFGLDVVR